MQNSASYRPELDGIRALCIIFTVAGHVPGKLPFVNGSVGVDVFFALSGWLITSLLLTEFQKNGSINLKSYYIRRIFRIVPLYFLTILFYYLASLIFLLVFNKGEELAEFIDGLPYLLSFNGEYMAHRDGLLFGHSWTLGIEEKFYLIWPVALLVLIPGRIVWLPVIAGIGIFALILPASSPELLLRGYVGLAAGAFTAVAASRSTTVADVLSRPFARWAGIAGMVTAYIASVVWPLTYEWNLMIAISAVPLIANLWIGKETNRVGAVLSWPPMAAAGRLTYAVYLTHVLVMNVVLQISSILSIDLGWSVNFLIVYVLALLVGQILHSCVEKPLIDLGRRLAKRSSLPSPVAA